MTATYSADPAGVPREERQAVSGSDPAELTAAAPSRVAATSAQTVLKEWLLAHQNVDRKIEGRLVYEE